MPDTQGTSLASRQRREIAHYLATGDHDLRCAAWPGDTTFEQMKNGDAAARTWLAIFCRAPGESNF